MITRLLGMIVSGEQAELLREEAASYIGIGYREKLRRALFLRCSAAQFQYPPLCLKNLLLRPLPGIHIFTDKRQQTIGQIG